MRYLIVGVDVGTTTAVAALNLECELVSLVSSRDFGVDKIIEHIQGLGTASVIASDVSVPPKKLSKISTSLGARLFIPYEPLSVEEKIRVTKDFNVRNSHERDALAAALNAYNKFKNRLKKAGILGLSDYRKHEVLQGGRLKERLPEKKQIDEKPVFQKPVYELSAEEKTIRSLIKQRKRLVEELAEKRGEVEALKEELKRIQYASSFKFSKAKEISHLLTKIKSKNKKIHELTVESNEIRLLWNKTAQGEITPVGLFPLNFQGVSFMPNRIPDDNEQALSKLSLAFTDDKKNRTILDEHGIPHAEEKHVKCSSGCFYVNTQTLENLRKPTKASIERMVMEYQTKRNLNPQGNTRPLS